MKKIEKGSLIIVRSCSRLKDCKHPCLGYVSKVTNFDDPRIEFEFIHSVDKKPENQCHIISGQDRFLLI